MENYLMIGLKLTEIELQLSEHQRNNQAFALASDRLEAREKELDAEQVAFQEEVMPFAIETANNSQFICLTPSQRLLDPAYNEILKKQAEVYRRQTNLLQHRLEYLRDLERLHSEMIKNLDAWAKKVEEKIAFLENEETRQVLCEVAGWEGKRAET